MQRMHNKSVLDMGIIRVVGM